MSDMEKATDRAVAAARDADWEAHHGGDPEPLKVGARELWGGGYEFLAPVSVEQEAEFIRALRHTISSVRAASMEVPKGSEARFALNRASFLAYDLQGLGRAVLETALDRGLTTDDHGNLIFVED